MVLGIREVGEERPLRRDCRKGDCESFHKPPRGTEGSGIELDPVEIEETGFALVGEDEEEVGGGGGRGERDGGFLP
jgi:hypothetical protein